MPTHERVRLHDRQQPTLFDHTRQYDQRHARRIIGAAWLHLAFEVQGQLFLEKEVLRGEVGT